MPDPRLRVPFLRRHKPSGQGVVTLSGKDCYLGPWPAAKKKAPPTVREAYDRLIVEWLANGRRLPSESEGLTVGELIVKFWPHAEQHYRHKDGTATSELFHFRLSLRPLRELYASFPVVEFSPLKLKAVRERMIGAGLCRNVVNQRVARIVRMFKWGVAEELVPETIHRALATVRGLKQGRSEARETEPIRPVDEGVVEATLPFLLPELADLVWLQLLTGMRPGEAVIIRACDIDRSEPVWQYRPGRHKTEHRGHGRVVPIGPKAQQLLLPHLASVAEDDFLFSPRRAMEAKRARQRAARKSPVQQSQVCRRNAKPKKKPGERWTVATYGRAIRRAAEAAGLPHWHPHQMRHTKATEIRREFGLHEARAVLGQRSLAVAERYAEMDQDKAGEVASRLG